MRMDVFRATFCLEASDMALGGGGGGIYGAGEKKDANNLWMTVKVILFEMNIECVIWLLWTI